MCFGWISLKKVDLSWSLKFHIDLYEDLPIKVNRSECHATEVANGRSATSRDHKVVGIWLLQHEPHRLHVIRCIAPIPFCVQVPETEFDLLAELDTSDTVSDFTGH